MPTALYPQMLDLIWILGILQNFLTNHNQDHFKFVQLRYHPLQKIVLCSFSVPTLSGAAVQKKTIFPDVGFKMNGIIKPRGYTLQDSSSTYYYVPLLPEINNTETYFMISFFAYLNRQSFRYHNFIVKLPVLYNVRKANF